MEPDVAAVSAAALRLGLETQVAVTSDELLAPFGVRGVPSSVFITAGGRVVGAATGMRDRKFFGARARALLDATEQERRNAGP